MPFTRRIHRPGPGRKMPIRRPPAAFHPPDRKQQAVRQPIRPLCSVAGNLAVIGVGGEGGQQGCQHK